MTLLRMIGLPSGKWTQASHRPPPAEPVAQPSAVAAQGQGTQAHPAPWALQGCVRPRTPVRAEHMVPVRVVRRASVPAEHMASGSHGAPGACVAERTASVLHRAPDRAVQGHARSISPQPASPPVSVPVGAAAARSGSKSSSPRQRSSHVPATSGGSPAPAHLVAPRTASGSTATPVAVTTPSSTGPSSAARAGGPTPSSVSSFR